MRTFWAGFGLVGLAVLVAASPTFARTVSHIAEDFASPRAAWPFQVDAGTGSAHVMTPESLLRIDTGRVMNEWSVVESARQYDTSWGNRHILEVRGCVPSAPVNPADQAFWGFHHSFLTLEFSVGFWVRFTPTGPVLEAQTRSGASVASQTLAGVDPREMHDYRIELVESTAQFYVNDALVWEHSGWEVPQALFHVRLAKASPGGYTQLEVDRVALREIVTPRAHFLSVDARDDLRSTGPRSPEDWPRVTVDADAAGLERPSDDEAGAPSLERSALREQTWTEIKSAWR